MNGGVSYKTAAIALKSAAVSGIRHRQATALRTMSKRCHAASSRVQQNAVEQDPADHAPVEGDDALMNIFTASHETSGVG